MAMGDCAINIHPSEDELVEIALETAKCAKLFGVEPQVAGAFNPSKIGPYASKLPRRCAIL